MRRKLPGTMSLIAFEAAARHENFTQAAREINLTQSALSRQIKQLEDLVAQPLFERIRQRVRLTDAGRHYLAQITPLLERLELETLRLPQFQNLAGGLNIGCYPTLGSRWLMPHLMAFNAAYPEINPNTITYPDNTAFNPQLVDIGIVQGDPPFPGCQHHFLMVEELAPLVSPDLIEGPTDDLELLMGQRLLQHLTRPQSWQIWAEDAGLSWRESQNVMLFSQFEMVLDAAVAGHGVALMPLILANKELASGRLIQAHPHVARPPHSYYLIVPEDKANNPKVNAFRDWLLSQIAEKN